MSGRRVELAGKVKAVLVAMEPSKGLGRCEIADCGRRTSVQVKHYSGLNDRETGRPERLCHKCFSRLQAEFAEIEVRQPPIPLPGDPA